MVSCLIVLYPASIHCRVSSLQHLLFLWDLPTLSLSTYTSTLNQVLEDSIAALKEQKRKIKQRAAENAALAAAGILQIVFIKYYKVVYQKGDI